MSDIRKHPAATGLRVCFRRRWKRRAAMGTVPCSHFILSRTTTAFFCEFATWHRNKISALPLDDLQISDNECLINRDGAKRAQSIIYVRHEFDSNLCDYHLKIPYRKSNFAKQSTSLGPEQETIPRATQPKTHYVEAFFVCQPAALEVLFGNVSTAVRKLFVLRRSSRSSAALPNS